MHCVQYAVKEAANEPHQIGSTPVCLSFHPMAKEHVHALKGLACRKRMAAASSPAAHLQTGCGAHVACATRLRLRQAFSRMLRSQKQ
jgi:hypothetical protein